MSWPLPREHGLTNNEWSRAGFNTAFPAPLDPGQEERQPLKPRAGREFPFSLLLGSREVWDPKLYLPHPGWAWIAIQEQVPAGVMASAQTLVWSCHLGLAEERALGMVKGGGGLPFSALTGWKLDFQCKQPDIQGNAI